MDLLSATSALQNQRKPNMRQNAPRKNNHWASRGLHTALYQQLLLTCYPADCQRGRKVTARASGQLPLQTEVKNLVSTGT